VWRTEKEMSRLSCTPKAVRRNGGNCVCGGGTWERRAEGACRAGYCTEFRCPDCGGELVSWGPIACPHKKNEMPRWVRHEGMQQPGRWDLEKDEYVPHRAAVKPSIAKRR
jgi:hypothetical protein